MIERLIPKGKPWWEVEIAFFIDECGLPPLDARSFTICRWMWNGDLRPLAASLEAGPLDAPVAAMLARLIREDRLQVRGKRGAGRKPERTGRDIIAALEYEQHPCKSDEAFSEIAEALGVSEQTIRNAVTKWRKRRIARN